MASRPRGSFRPGARKPPRKRVRLLYERRIVLFLCLPLATISKMAIKKEIEKIGHQ